MKIHGYEKYANRINVSTLSGREGTSVLYMVDMLLQDSPSVDEWVCVSTDVCGLLETCRGLLVTRWTLCL